MKKVISFLTAVCLLCVCIASASATTTVDLSQISGDTDTYTIDVNTDKDIAFVTTTISASDRSFEHEDENENYYSCFETDMLIHNYSDANPYAVLRTWIYYYATEYIYPTSVTFTIGETDYTFSNAGDDTWSTDDGKGGTSERLLIIYGDTSETYDFMTAIFDWYSAMDEGITSDNSTIRMTIHGTKDVVVTLNSTGIPRDFFLIVSAMSDIGGKLEDCGSDATPLKIIKRTRTNA